MWILVSNCHAKKEAQYFTHSHRVCFPFWRKVVDLLEMILSETRRKLLGVNLLKAIVRMLFENRTDKAEKLLQAEWERSDTILDIRLIFVVSAIEAVTSASPTENVELEWGVVESLSRRASEMSNDLLVHLFCPYWAGCDSRGSIFDFLSLQNEEERNSTLLFLQANRPSSWKRYRISDDAVRKRYFQVIETMEGATDDHVWKDLASCYKLTFRIACPTTDPEVISYLKECALQIPLQGGEWDTFLRKVWSALLGSACLSNILKERAEKPQEEWRLILNQSETASIFRKTYGSLLASLLETPIRQKTARKQLSFVLQTLSSQIRRQLPNLGWDELIIPFKDEISLLSSDSQALSVALTGTSFSSW